MRTLRLLLPLLIATCLTSCRTSAPPLDYQALARASVRLGMDIDADDNHNLYLTSAEWIGVPYRSGGMSKQGTDCSGLATQIYSAVFHITLPRNTSGQMESCRKVRKGSLREGDLVFFCSPSSDRVSHVGVYLKDKQFIHASSSHGVMVSSLKEDYWKECWLRGGRIKK